MRLINVDTMKIEEDAEPTFKCYLILSHTWTDQEISFQDYMWLQNYDEEVAGGIIDELPPKQKARTMAKAEALRQLAGYKKVFDFIRNARGLLRMEGGAGLHGACPMDQPLYVWVDTCCINKESSAELSEAINSMYRWYQSAELCVAILSDVTSVHADPQGDFGKSRWFRRGWTLQELLAPNIVAFYNANDEFIGRRSNLARPISTVTSIPERFLVHRSDQSYCSFRDATIAQKMSWIAGRETTRTEDMAYCVLGIFDVNMPLLYGEGYKAFVRLQQEIIKTSEDQTIIAWGYGQSVKRQHSKSVFASRPSEFSGCGTLGTDTTFDDAPATRGLLSVDQSFEMTNAGLRISLAMFQLREGVGKLYAALPVFCDNGGAICLPVIWRGSGSETKDIENMPEGAIIERCEYEQPVAAPLVSLDFLRGTAKAVRKSVLLRSPRPPATPWDLPEIFKTSADSPKHCLRLSEDDWCRTLEVWAPHMEIDQRSDLRLGALDLYGSSEQHRLDPWPVFIRVTGYAEMGRPLPAKQYLLAASFNLDPPAANWTRTYDWDTVRTTCSPPVTSLLGLYLSSLRLGAPAMKSAPWPEVSTADQVEAGLEWIRPLDTSTRPTGILNSHAFFDRLLKQSSQAEPAVHFRIYNPAKRGGA